MTPITWYLYGRSGGAKKAVEEIGVKGSVSGSVAAFSDGANDVAVKSLVAEITPVQSGSGDPSPTNIRPISGRTGLTVTRAGRNIAQISNIDIPAGVNQILDISDYMTLAAGTYTLSWTFTGNVTMTRNQPAFNVENVGHTYSGVNCTTSGRYSWTFTLAEETTLIFRWWYHTVSAACKATDFMLEFGDTAHEYAPYVAPTTYPITWQTEAGEVYGGTLDVVSGVLTVDRAMATFDGSSDEYWYYYSIATGNLFRITIEDRISQIITSYPDKYACNSYHAAPNPSTGRTNGTFSGSTYNVDFVDDRYSTLEDWRAALAQTPIQFVYPLATPQTYQLTPTEVRTLLGGNTIYTDAGAVSVEYVADTKLYIDNKVAELQALILEN